MEKRPQVHLGDGAYAEFDGYSFRLWANRESGIHEVFLEPSAIVALNRFVESVRNQPQ